MAAEQVEAVQPGGPSVKELARDQAYYSDDTLVALKGVRVRTYLSEPERGRHPWDRKREAQQALSANRRRICGVRGRRLLRCRGELVERPFAHLCETGRLRRVCGCAAIPRCLQGLLVHAAGCNLGLLLRHLTGISTPRSLQGRAFAAIRALIACWIGRWGRLTRVWVFKPSLAALAGPAVHLQAA